MADPVAARPRRAIWKWLFLTFAALYLLSLLLLAVGTFGWLGQDRDPLSGVFLLPLGLPWNYLLDAAGIGSDQALPLILAPLVNAGILYWLWRR